MRRFLRWRPKSQGGNGDAKSAPASTPGSIGPLLPRLRDGVPRRTVALVVLGIAEDQMGAVIDKIAELEAELDVVPLLLTDLDDFELFASRRYVFEHFPSPRSQELAPQDLPWDAYLERRLELLQRKWQPVALIPFGEIAGRVVRKWRAQRENSRAGWQTTEAAS